GETYFKLLKIFFDEESCYYNLSLEAAVMYSLLLDRLQYSIKNGWVDHDGNIFFYFINKSLKQKLRIKSDTKLIAVKHELEAAGLLIQKHVGLNKPNRLYLLRPEITAKDVYRIKHESADFEDDFTKKAFSMLEPQGTPKNRVPEKTVETLESQGTLKNVVPENSSSTLQPQETPKNGVYQYKDNIDINKIHKDTKKSNTYPSDCQNANWDLTAESYSATQVESQNQSLLNNARNYIDSTFDGELPFILDKSTMLMVTKFMHNPQELKDFIGTIILAKNNAVKTFRTKNEQSGIDTTGIGASFEIVNYTGSGDVISHGSLLKDRINKTVYRFFNRCRANEGDPKQAIKNPRGYLYKAIYKTVVKDLNDQLEKHHDRQTVTA
ncbi:replication initiator protein A, partial [Lactobacillus sp. ESL0791]|uniref:replication initiator protein A n=1 Tax=Lactobacillus sp. ESL0791 TaxID=2983234 RepID=UPI0023F895B7